MIQKEELLSEIKEQKNKLISITTKWELLGYEKTITALQEKSNSSMFWQTENYASTLKQETDLIDLQKNIHIAKNTLFEIEEILQDTSNSDAETLNEINEIIKKNKKLIDSLSIQLLLNKPNDSKNCFLDINSGAGGTEAQDWALMLLRMYARFCEQNNFKYTLIDELKGEGAGIKNATLYIKGDFATGLLESEIGIHRLVRISPFDANKRRHTSFAAVSITPETDDISIEINQKDLRIDTFRASGAGGQHVNKTDSAVRITHLPTGIVVQCQNERSQLQNKEQAMKALKSKLYYQEELKRQADFENIERKKIEWGSQIRSYVLHPYKMIKDHRTNYESSQTEKILDGALFEIIEQYLLHIK